MAAKSSCTSVRRHAALRATRTFELGGIAGEIVVLCVLGLKALRRISPLPKSSPGVGLLVKNYLEPLRNKLVLTRNVVADKTIAGGGSGRRPVSLQVCLIFVGLLFASGGVLDAQTNQPTIAYAEPARAPRHSLRKLSYHNKLGAPSENC